MSNQRELYLEGEPLPRQRLPRLDGDVDLLVDQPLGVARALRLPEQVVHPVPGTLHVGPGSVDSRYLWHCTDTERRQKVNKWKWENGPNGPQHRLNQELPPSNDDFFVVTRDPRNRGC